MRTWQTLAMGSIALLTVAALGWQRSSGAAHDDQATAAADLRALRAETERLRQEVAALKRGEGAMAAPAVPSGFSPELAARLSALAQQQAGAQQQGEPRPQATPAEERESALEYAGFLDEHLDSSASSEDATVASLRAGVAQVVDNTSVLLDLKCGKDLCRMNTRHANGEAYRAFQAKAFQHTKSIWSGPATFVVLEESEDPRSPVVVATYLGRGDALPSPEAPR